MSLIVKNSVPHLDSLMKLLDLSLEVNVLYWFTSLPNHSIRDENQLLKNVTSVGLHNCNVFVK